MQPDLYCKKKLNRSRKQPTGKDAPRITCCKELYLLTKMAQKSFTRTKRELNGFEKQTKIIKS